MKNIWNIFGFKKKTFLKKKTYKKRKSKIIIKDGIRYRIVRARKKLSKKEKEIEHLRYLENKEKAREVVVEKLKYWQEFYKNIQKESSTIYLEYKKVFIKNTSTRWGSCSSKKNLNFSYKIVFLENSVQDYLIVHELCHLKEMNHGENFWNLVSLAIPAYKEKRREMKTFKS